VVLESLKKLIGATGIDLTKLIKKSLKVLTADQNENHYFLRQGKIGGTDEAGRKKLQHVDMIFRLYLPLFALLKQTNYLIEC